MRPPPIYERPIDNLIQRLDDARGRFFDRVWVFPFDPTVFVNQTTSTAADLTAQSQGARHIRVLAIRAVLAGSDTGGLTPTPLDTAQLRLRLQLNGSDWVTDQAGGNDVSFATLSTKKSPWYWYAGALVVRAGDILHAEVNGRDRPGEAPGLVPEVSMRVMDAKLYDRLYARALGRRTRRTDAAAGRACALGLVDDGQGDGGGA